jgi:hypothetical protein
MVGGWTTRTGEKVKVHSSSLSAKIEINLRLLVLEVVKWEALLPSWNWARTRGVASWSLVILLVIAGVFEVVAVNG